MSHCRKREASVALEHEETPLQIRPTWRGPTKEPPAEEAMEVEDYDPPWTARERVALDNTEKYVEKGESIQVDVGELEHFLLGPEDADISITSFAENARDEGGYGRFVLLDTLRGKGAGRGVDVEAGRDVRRREAVSATEGGLHGPYSEWSTRPDPSQETS